MINYVKCPRCDLNYIDEDKQEYCDVCLAEMRGTKLQFADLEVDEEELDEELEEEGATEVCPVCGVNRMRVGDKMCDMCKKNEEFEQEEEVDPENDDEWKNYLDEDDGEDLTVDDEELAEELDGDGEEETETADDEDDFFESEDVDSLSDLDDDDDEDGYDDDEDDEF